MPKTHLEAEFEWLWEKDYINSISIDYENLTVGEKKQ